MDKVKKWDKEIDVIVVGSGAAGLAAAIEAAENKATVVVLEKMPFFGGNSLFSGGNYGAYGTDLQQKKGIGDLHFSHDSAELYYQEKRALGGYRSDPTLARTFTHNSLTGYKWLKNLGLEYQTVEMAGTNIASPFDQPGEGDILTKGRHHLEGRYGRYEGGRALMHCLRDRAQRLGIDLLTKMEVREIIREHGLSGEVLGVRVKDQGAWKILTVRARKAVIIATGGFTAHTAMCAKYDPRIHPRVRNTGMKGVTGDLLLAAQDVGADTMNMDFIQIRMGKSAFGYRHKVMATRLGTYIDVDTQGRRFWKEMNDNKSAVRNERLSQTHVKNMHLWYAITDSEGIRANGVNDEEVLKNLKIKRVFSSPTLEELAGQIDVPLKNLVETVTRYNSLVAGGRDEDFGQIGAFLKHPITVPPFFAMPKTYYIHVTLGGVRPNEKAQVIDRRGKVIPRLYAAGEVTGGIHGEERNGGCGITECIVFGRIAGEGAAREISK